MRILVYTRAFAPLVGGLEAQTALLADQLVRRGHDVVVATTTPSTAADGASYRILRQPGALALLRWTRWCDVYYQANVSLRGLWPLLVVRRPWVVSHHSWYRRSDGRIAWPDRLKRRLVRHAAASIAVSRAIARDLGDPATLVIPNAYRDDLFRRLPGVPRDRELLFVGRLVSDKGCDLLLDALALLVRTKPAPQLTVVGEGPDRAALAAQARRLGLEAQVRFLGTRTGEDLVRLMNQHRVIVVPSRYEEPFGMVALEGLACGCRVVASAGGGLPEAIGPGGRSFSNLDVGALAEALVASLGGEDAGPAEAEALAAHLARHSGASVGAEYERALAAANRR